MKQELKIFLTNIVTVILALELRAFFEKGGGSNDLAFTIFKIIMLSIFGVCIINMDDVTRVIIHKLDPTIPEGENNGTLSITKLLRHTLVK
jgi:hypothetical protein